MKREGLTELLTEAGPGTSLVSRAIESLCRVQADGLTFTVAPPGGFVEGSSTLSVRVATRDGMSPGSLAIRAGWTAKDVEPSVVLVTTDTQGVARLELPSGETFQQSRRPARRLDEPLRGRAVFRRVGGARCAGRPSSIATVTSTTSVRISPRRPACPRVPSPPGPRPVTVAPRGRRLPARRRRVSSSSTAIPVTNALYGMFLDDTRSGAFPEYWDNPVYNQDDQPVIGVTLEDANRFAAWLSERLGVVKRLPTEDEWEKAARAGQDVIYPWGDQSPAEGARANYSGNGRFTAPSPVGSFEAGANAYGLLDMAGNVWQWTSTAYGAGAGAGRGRGA